MEYVVPNVGDWSAPSVMAALGLLYQWLKHHWDITAIVLLFFVSLVMFALAVMVAGAWAFSAARASRRLAELGEHRGR